MLAGMLCRFFVKSCSRPNSLNFIGGNHHSSCGPAQQNPFRAFIPTIARCLLPAVCCLPASPVGGLPVAKSFFFPRYFFCYLKCKLLIIITPVKSGIAQVFPLVIILSQPQLNFFFEVKTAVIST